MTSEDRFKDRRRWSWKQFLLAMCMVVAGLLCWVLGLGTALGAGSSGVRSDDWLVPIAEHFFRVGPFVSGLGLIWLLALIIRQFWPNKTGGP